MIGHEGDGSLLSYLKQLGLAIELVSGEKNSAPGFNFFTVDLELTIEGLSKHKIAFKRMNYFFVSFETDQWERVIYIVYQYFAMLRQESPKEWIYEEYKVSSNQYFIKQK